LFKEKHIDMPICFTSIKQIYDKKNAQLIISTLKKEYKEQKGVSIFELLKNKNKLVKEFANLIYLNFYKNYTEKQ
jgi:UDP-galactopyranose mutase